MNYVESSSITSKTAVYKTASVRAVEIAQQFSTVKGGGLCPALCTFFLLTLPHFALPLFSLSPFSANLPPKDEQLSAELVNSMGSAKESLSVRTGARKERGWKREATTTQTIPLVWHFYSHLTNVFVFLVLPQSYLKKTKPAVHLRRKLCICILYKRLFMYSHSRMSETCSGRKYSALIVSTGIQFLFV